jgi:hypothetical protein
VSALLIAAITFACAFGTALAGAFIRDRLPAPHLAKDSQDVVRLGMGLVATMTALLLGLVTASARSTYDAQDAAIKTSSVNILTLDRHLAEYGPETKPTRDLIRDAVAFRLEAIWPSDGSGGNFASSSSPVPPIERIQTQILALAPATDAQRWLKGEALKLSDEVVKTRWRLLGITGAIPQTFLFVVIFWLSVTFASFGLYAPRNATVIGVLFFAALSVALALFLIVELDGPFEGLIKVSSNPIRFTLENLGK